MQDCLNELGNSRVRTERFTSLTGDPFTAAEAPAQAGEGTASEVEVTLDGRTSTVAWPRGGTLLDALLNAGLDAPHSCREGACSACACVLLEGEVDLELNEVLDAQDLAEGLILACQAVALTEQLKVTYDV